MGGEFELNPDFLWKQPVPGSGDISTQILFFMFVIFVTIIIANLLIGLTVNQTDKLVKEADIIRLQRVVYMIEFKAQCFKIHKKKIAIWGSCRFEILDNSSS